MLSNVIAWIASLFFVFMAGAFMVWALKRENITPSESVVAIAYTIGFLALAWGAAALGGV